MTNLGFEFHHCTKTSLMLIKKLARYAEIPASKNYIVGVGAVVVDKGKLLVVKDRFSNACKFLVSYLSHRHQKKQYNHDDDNGGNNKCPDIWCS